MTTMQKVIKYAALAFALFLALSIIGGIVGGVALLGGFIDSDTTTDDLKGKLIGVQQGTTSDFAAEEITGMENVQRFNTFLNAIMELAQNKIDAVIIDKPVGQAIMASLKDDSLVMVDMGLQADWYGIAVNKDNTELLDKINAALVELEAEGYFDELAVKYFGGEAEEAPAEEAAAETTEAAAE